MGSIAVIISRSAELIFRRRGRSLHQAPRGADFFLLQPPSFGALRPPAVAIAIRPGCRLPHHRVAARRTLRHAEVEGARFGRKEKRGQSVRIWHLCAEASCPVAAVTKQASPHAWLFEIAEAM